MAENNLQEEDAQPKANVDEPTNTYMEHQPSILAVLQGRRDNLAYELKRLDEVIAEMKDNKLLEAFGGKMWAVGAILTR